MTMGDVGEDTWKNKKYYLKAKEASEGWLDHPGLQIFREIVGAVPLSRKATARRGWVLEVGVGEGSKLASIIGEGSVGVGVDVSLVGLEMAREAKSKKRKSKSYNLKVKGKNAEYRKQHFDSAQCRNSGGKSGNTGFVQGDGGRLPFGDGWFDFVYSAFTLEHLEEPERVIREMIRVVRKGGRLGFLAPNFGAPNRASPCFRGSRMRKLLKGVVRDWLLVVSSKDRRVNLDWQEVEPIATREKYEIDWDTVVEPYVLSLVSFLRDEGVKIEEVSSCWDVDLNVPVWQFPLKMLGRLGVYPFKYWGPHLLVVGRKS
jgi:ubiquinone/menaquinone biosynthesis C-methylase UbiE